MALFFEGIAGISGFDQSDISVAQLSDASQSNSLGLEEDDVFQCGKCKQSFTSLTFFLAHKKEICAKKGRVFGKIISGEDIERSLKSKSTSPSSRPLNDSSSLLSSNIIQINESDYLSLANNLDSGHGGLNLGEHLLGSDTLSLLNAGSPVPGSHCELDSLNNSSPTPASPNNAPTFPVSFLTGGTALLSSNDSLLLSASNCASNEASNDNDSLSSVIPTTSSSIIHTSLSSNILLNISHPATVDSESSITASVISSQKKTTENLHALSFSNNNPSHPLKSSDSNVKDEERLCESFDGSESPNPIFAKLISDESLNKESLKVVNSDKKKTNLKNDENHSLESKKACKLKCDFCDRAFNKNFDLQQHIRCHTGEKPFQCIVCGRAFAQKSNVKKHMQTHKVWPDGLANTLAANSPSESISTINISSSIKVLPIISESPANELNNDSEEKPSPSLYACPYCSYMGKTYFELKSHMKSHKREKVYKCIQSSCGKMFAQLEPFLAHIHSHENEMTYSCHLCCKTFKSLCELGDHQHSHALHPKQDSRGGQRFFRCSKCLNKYTTSAALEHHIATSTHHYPCPHCEKVFPCERYLRRHLLTHGSCLHICQFCDKTFKTANYLKVHLVIHTGEKPFTCNICNAAFNRQDKLKRHKLVHDPVKRFKCPLRVHTGCQKEFNRHDKLKAHMLTHCGIKPHACSQCGRSFSRRAHLRTHMNAHLNSQSHKNHSNPKRNEFSGKNSDSHFRIEININDEASHPRDYSGLEKTTDFNQYTKDQRTVETLLSSC